MNKKESREDYLEAILVLENKQDFVRAIDIASELGFSKPSVSIAMKKLKEEELIIVKDDGSISLTEKGKEIAKKTLEKHEFLTNFFIELGIEPDMAEDEACQIEHLLNDLTFDKLREYVERNKRR